LKLKKKVVYEDVETVEIDVELIVTLQASLDFNVAFVDSIGAIWIVDAGSTIFLRFLQ
jgi:hypothetical protein